MKIAYKIKLGSNHQNSKQIEQTIDSVFKEVNEIYNNWNVHSEISKLNALKANEKIKLSSELATFLDKIDEIVDITEGRFDPTVGGLVEYWKKGEWKEFEEQKDRVGWSKIHHLDGWFWKEHDELKLDLCGIAKGYAVDLLIERLSEAGVENMYVEWGGEIRCLGKHPENREWRIGIIGSDLILPLIGKAVATSGDYYQLWKYNDKTYTHIFNPLTLRPLEVTAHSIASSTVTASTCLLADALATATMLFDTDAELLNWTEKLHARYADVSIWIRRR